MKNDASEVLYVGKAKNLKQRVSSYLKDEHQSRYQIEFLMRRVKKIEWVLTHTEKEALLLENTLIKKYKPKYNLCLKDDKNYLSLKLSSKHSFPRISATRQILKDGSDYFGPYTSALQAREVLDFIQQYFKLRDCSDHEFSNRSRPCLQYQIKRCDAPCVGYMSQESYAQKVKQAKYFLQGKSDELTKEVQLKMQQASEACEFEEAIFYRNLLFSMRALLEKQQVFSMKEGNYDVIALAREGERVSILIHPYRDGKLEQSKHYNFKSLEEDEECLSSFVLQYYTTFNHSISQVYLSLAENRLSLLNELITENFKRRLICPSRGLHLEQLNHAQSLALKGLQNFVASPQVLQTTLKNIQTLFELKNLPKRVECFDISNFQGDKPVASCVCFEDGEKNTKGYRRFKVNLKGGQNDFAMLYEVLTRRLKKIEWGLPDLIVIDGGKGQLSSAYAALKDAGLENEIDMISLAKERNAAENKEKKEERIFLLGRKNPIILRKHSSELHFFVHLRDEAHRFAISYQQKLQRQKSLASR